MSRKLTIRHRIAKDIVEDYLYECAIENIEKDDSDTTFLDEDGSKTEITDGENDNLCDVLDSDSLTGYEIDNNGDYVVIFDVDVEDYDEEEEDDD